MSNAYKYQPEYRQRPLEPEIREAAYGAYIDSTNIDRDCEQRPSGMYIAKESRFDKAPLLDEISDRSNIGLVATQQALYELKILKIIDYSDTYSTLVHPQAILFTDAYQEEHSKQAFRFAPHGKRQYFWDGSAGALREERDRLMAFKELKQAGRINRSPTIPRHIGQFVSRRLQA